LIPKETIDLVIDTARIEEVVGDFVSLKKRGANYLGNCPFHNEKTPSFTVSAAKGIYKCFGCGQAGNSVKFIMEHEHYSYPEAIKYLANKYNIEIREEINANWAEEQQQVQEKESLFMVSEFARKFFTETLLNSDEGKAIGLSYFKERGFRQDIIEKFQLGYSPENRTALFSAAVEKSYNPQTFSKAGLLVEKDNPSGEKDKFFDRFSGRVMFPIHNLSGRVIGFGGRTLRSDKKVAKYINSPETSIYVKSKVLYGISYAKKAIGVEDNCFLVEGYTDVISFHQCGIENVVASSGTSLTVEQIRLIKRYTNNITILYDGDEAGIKASLRGINLILEEGMNVKVVLFPDGEDPDSFARTRNSDEVKTFISKNASDFIVFKSSLLLKDVQNDPIKRAGLITEIIQTISLIPDAIIRSVYVKECSNILDVAEQTLLNELNKLRRKKINKEAGDDVFSEDNEKQPVQQQEEYSEEVAEKTYFCEAQEKDIVRILLNYGEVPMEIELEEQEGETTTIFLAEVIFQTFDKDEVNLEHPLYNRICKEIRTLISENPEPNIGQKFIHHPVPEISAFAIEALTSRYELNNWEKHSIFVKSEKDKFQRLIMGSIAALNGKRLEKEELEIRKALSAKPPEEEEMRLMMRKAEIINIKKSLNKEFGRIIIR
jgi:DNA primase